MALLIASSASTEQCILTGGNASSSTIAILSILKASSIFLPFSHSVAKDDDAIADPHPKVLNFASIMVSVASSTSIWSLMTSPHSGAPTSPVPTFFLLVNDSAFEISKKDKVMRIYLSAEAANMFKEVRKGSNIDFAKYIQQ